MPTAALRGCTPNPPATCEWSRLNPLNGVADLAPWQFDMYVGAEADGVATAEQLAVLEANPVPWRAALLTMVREAEEHLASARTLPGEERDQVVADLESERRRLADAYERLTSERIVGERPLTGAPAASESGRRRGARSDAPAPEEELPEDGPALLQVSWEPGRVVAWAGGPHAPIGDREQVMKLLVGAGAPEAGWTKHAAVPLPGGANADAYAIPVGDVLGWLVAAGADRVGDEIGPGVRWLGEVAIWAVELTARGAMVPLLRRRTRRSQSARESSGSFAVRWTPALVDGERLDAHGQRDAGHVAGPRPQGRSRGHSPVRRSAAWSTRSAATARGGSRCRHRRRTCVPATTSPRRSSRGSTAVRSTRR